MCLVAPLIACYIFAFKPSMVVQCTILDNYNGKGPTCQTLVGPSILCGWLLSGTTSVLGATEILCSILHALLRVTLDTAPNHLKMILGQQGERGLILGRSWGVGGGGEILILP